MEKNQKHSSSLHLKNDAIDKHFNHEAPVLNTEDWLFVAGAVVTLLIAIAVGIHYFQNL